MVEWSAGRDMVASLKLEICVATRNSGHRFNAHVFIRKFPQIYEP